MVSAYLYVVGCWRVKAKLESLLQRQMEAEEEHARTLSEMQSALAQSQHDALEATSQACSCDWNVFVFYFFMWMAWL